jgi:transcriptional regulator CtsR
MSIDLDFETLETITPVAPVRRGDGMIRVQVVPFVRNNEAQLESTYSTAGSLISEQLIVDYIASLAQHAVKAVRNGEVDLIDDDHAHPADVACLRCAVTGSTHMRTLATALLEILASGGADEEWNNSASATEVQMISRLRRLAVSSADLEALYGVNWAQVIVAALRAEAATLEMVDYLTRGHSDVLWINELMEDPDTARQVMASYHLGTIVCPNESWNEESSVDLKRDRIARRFAVAMAKVAQGETVSWLDHLPAPPL